MERILDMPEQQQPREKLAQHGVSALSDAELLALFIRTGVQGQNAIELGKRLIKQHGNLSNLGRLELKQLSAELGLGIAKSCQILAAFELGARVAKEQIQRLELSSPETIYTYVQPMLEGETQEVLLAFLLDTKNCHLKTIEVTRGILDQTLWHPRNILKPAILHDAKSIVIVHNHPSGDCRPSHADISMTQAIKEASELLKIRLLDHIIIGKHLGTQEPYYSFQEHGRLSH